MDSSVYDCIVDTGKKLLKVQIKSTIKKPGKERTTVHCALRNAKGDYNEANVHYFAIWSEYFNGFFIFKNKGNMQSIRLSLRGKNSKYFNNFALK